MPLSTLLQDRSNAQCELCKATGDLNAYTVPPKNSEEADDQMAACETCLQQIQNPEQIEINHWRCLNESIWTPSP